MGSTCRRLRRQTQHLVAAITSTLKGDSQELLARDKRVSVDRTVQLRLIGDPEVTGTAALNPDRLNLASNSEVLRITAALPVTRPESQKTNPTTSAPTTEYRQHSEFGDLVWQRLDDV
jgi:hypothetical protein